MFDRWIRRKAATSAEARLRAATGADAKGGVDARGLLPPLVVEAERIARQMMAGVHGQRRAGTGEDFWQYRPAEPHEPASRIDWRQSARGDSYWVREREAEGAQQIMFWCDPSASMDWRSTSTLPTKRERAMLCTLALASAMLRGGERAGLMSGPEAGRHFSGPQSYPRLAQGLLFTKTDDSAPRADFVRSHGRLVLVSDFLWPLAQLQDTLTAIGARPARTELLCILDPAEISLPYRGRVHFEGVESRDGLTLPAVEELAPAYEAAMRDHIAALRDLAGDNHASVTVHQTDHSPMPALLGLYARLSGGRLAA